MTSNSAHRNHVFSRRSTSQDLLDTDSDDDIMLTGNSDRERFLSENIESQLEMSSDVRELSSGLRQAPDLNVNAISSAGPSHRQVSARIKSPRIRDKQEKTSSISDSDESDEMGMTKQKKSSAVGEYDPTQYEYLDVNEEIKDIFQYIAKYTPQQLNLDFKFKPFIPDFIPAVGDIDAFLKVMPPDVTLSGQNFSSNDSQLGLIVLDEPAANQSDPALLHLQLRATSITVNQNSQTMVVKKVDNVEKNSKIIDKWIKNVAELHKNKSASVVRYSKRMPDIEQLMQEWPEEFENSVKEHGIPSPQFCGNFSQYVDVICAVFDIPIRKNKIESLHVLFSLYAAINNSQLYKETNGIEEKETTENKSDHLVLD